MDELSLIKSYLPNNELKVHYEEEVVTTPAVEYASTYIVVCFHRLFSG